MAESPTLIVKELPFAIDDQYLYNMFNTYGHIVFCKVVVDEIGVSKGYGFVQYETMEAAENAIKHVNGMLLNDKKISISHKVSKKEHLDKAEALKPDFTNIYVENVDGHVTDKEFNALFERFGAAISSSHAREEEGGSDMHHLTHSTPSPHNNLPPFVPATAMIIPYDYSLKKKTHGNICNVSLLMEVSPKSKSSSFLVPSSPSLLSSPSATTNSTMPSPSPSPTPMKREQIPPNSSDTHNDLIHFRRRTHETKLNVLPQHPRVDVDPTEYHITPFTPSSMSMIRSILARPLDPDLFKTSDSETRQSIDIENHVKEFIRLFIQKYENPEECGLQIQNAMTFYWSYLNGSFVPYVKNVIVVFEGSFQVWEYEDSNSGEIDVLGELMKQKHGAFAMPGKGYWTTNFVFKNERRRSDVGKRALLMCAGEDSSYEIDAEVTVNGQKFFVTDLTFDTGCTGPASALCLFQSDYKKHGSPNALQRWFRTVTGEEGLQLVVKADCIKINDVEEPIADVTISYLYTSAGYRTFGLAGINRFAVLMFERLAVIGNTVDEVELVWYKEFFELEDEEETAIEEKSTDVMLHPLQSHSPEGWEGGLTASGPSLSCRIQCGAISAGVTNSASL